MKITSLQKISFMVLRIMSSLIFITAGLNHLFQTDGATARLEKAPLGHLATWVAPAEILIILSGIGLLSGGIMLLLGFRTKLAALLLLFLLIPITLTVQVANAAGSGPLFKNIALLGMLLFFIVNGARYYSLDQFLQHSKKPGNSSKGLRTGRYAAVLATSLMLLLGSCANGISITRTTAPQTGKIAMGTQNYAVLISQPNHLKAAVNTAETITPDSQYRRDKFVVMACAKSVEAFVKGSDKAAEFRKGQAAGITYKICGMSLKQFHIDPATLMDGVEIIPNGLTYMFELQQQDYVTVEL